MILQPTRDARLINGFASHPEVVEGTGCAVDLTGAIRPSNVFLFGEHGGFLFEWCAPGTYEVHVMLTRAGRGRWGFAAALEARATIENMGAERLWARVADERRDLACFTQRSGFREVERRVLFVGDEPSEWRIFEWRSKSCHQ